MTEAIERPPAPPAEPEAAADDGQVRRLVMLAAVFAAIGLLYGVSALLVILAIVVMIFLHELGHYTAARLTGMKATEFFIGFGPKIWSFKRGETEYGVKSIPAGAYVRIIGMHNLEEVDPADEPRTYRQQTFPRRLLVVAGGPLMNILTAVVLLFALFVGFGRVDEDEWKVGLVSEGSAAAAGGIQVDDQIVSIDGVAVDGWESLTDQIEQHAGDAITLGVERGGEVIDLTTVVGERLSERGAAGLDGLVEGDVIVAFEGRPVGTYDEFASLARPRTGETVEVTIRRGGAQGVVLVTVDEVAATGATDGFLGVARELIAERDNPAVASWEAVKTTGEITKAFVVGTAEFFTPSRIGSFFAQVADTAAGNGDDEAAPLQTGTALEQTGISEEDQNRVVSIIGVVDFGRQISEEGPAALLAFLASISIMFGVINLIPLLPFDGGHITVAIYERLRERDGRRYHVDIAKLMPVMYAVIAVFAVLGIAAAYLDVVDGIQV